MELCNAQRTLDAACGGSGRCLSASGVGLIAVRRTQSVELPNDRASWFAGHVVEATSNPDRCPFCAIAAGNALAREILRTDSVLAFLPDVPAVLGHTLVVPTAHLPDIWSVGEGQLRELASVTRRVAAAVAEATNAEGLNVIQSNGAAAGQTVFHLHIHVVPRNEGDRMPRLWPDDADWQPAQLDSITERLHLALERHG